MTQTPNETENNAKRDAGADANAPYRCWPSHMPFRKDGMPVVSGFGSTTQHCVIMTSETFKRLIREHPSLATARFEFAEYV